MAGVHLIRVTGVSQSQTNVFCCCLREPQAEIYEALQGIGGEPDGLATLLRLEPVVNDICTQLSDSFKQAVTKRLLPEVSKLLGASGWSSQHLGFGPAEGSPHLDNGDDISPSAFVSGAGQTLGPDQGPATVATVVLQPPGATQAPTQQLHAPGESRFGFAKDAITSAVPVRAISAGGSSGTPPPGPVPSPAAVAQRPPSAALPSNGSASDLIPSDLLGNALPAPFATSNVIGPTGLPTAAQAARNAAPAGVPQLQQQQQQDATGPFTRSSLPSTLSSHNQPAGPSFASPPGAISHQLAQLTLSSSAASQHQQHQHQHPNGFGLLGPGLRGSSLDPGLSGPPIPLSGTEPLRSPANPVVGQFGLGGGGSGQLSLLGSALGSALGPAGQHAPVPMFGGAPGPTHGSASQQQQQRVQQLLLQSIQQGAGLGEEPVGAGGLSLQQLQQLQQQQQQRAALAGYGGQGLPPQQQPQQQMTNGSATLLQQQLLLQQQQQAGMLRNDALAAYQLSLQQLQQQQQQQQQAFLSAAGAGGAGGAGSAQLSGRASVDGRFAGASILQQHQQQLEQQQLLQQLQADPALLQQYLQQQQGQPPRGMGLGGGASLGPAALYRSSAGFAGDGSTPGGPGSVATNPASVGTAPSDDGIDYGSIFSMHHSHHHHHQQGVPSPGLAQAAAGLPAHHPAAAGPTMAPLPMSDLRSGSVSSTASGGLRDLQFGGVGGYPGGAPGMRASPPVDAQAQLQQQQQQQAPTLAAQQQQQQGVVGRLATRSGAASSVADSRSSSFSGVAGSGGGAATGGATVPSPPGSDAAGPAEGGKAPPPLSMAAKLQQVRRRLLPALVLQGRQGHDVVNSLYHSVH